ncbi:MAG: YaiI/YqxD family protein [Myxococcales bacterium]|jgi:uncharacterized protein YaiI (UPF0178 family)
MRIWVDADARPGAVKEIILRAAKRVAVRAVFVANKHIHVPPGPLVSTVRVPAGLDVADGHIARESEAKDLAITADIPLAAKLVAKGVVVIDPRGTLYDEESIGEALSVRNFMHELREAGVATSGPGAFSPRDSQQFAAALDRALAAARRG